ncbi:MAG: SIS domain-containing protein, partial [Candidatus Omnitrophica bacterium]|nr:SIS domain-containing protein [Candidatus Omnitrophota bacterium]
MNRANILDDIRTIKRFDRSDMLDILTSFPGQCRSGAALGEMAFLPVTLKKIKFKNIVCTGLGGSAIGADIARSYLAGSLDLPIVVNRDYLLPEFVDSGTLLIVSSYSGNTEETISAYKDGRKRGARIVVITSGGRIKEMADRDGYPVSIIP